MHWVVVADQLEQISDHGDKNDRDWRDLDSDMDSFDKAVADSEDQDRRRNAAHRLRIPSCKAVAPPEEEVQGLPVRQAEDAESRWRCMSCVPVR
jgi:hypothetical protein